MKQFYQARHSGYLVIFQAESDGLLAIVRLLAQGLFDEGDDGHIMNDSKQSIYAVEEIDESYNDQLSTIVDQSPINAAGLKIVFDRRPNPFLLPRLRSRALTCAGFFIRGRLCGFSMMLHKDLLVNGIPQQVLYFGNMVLAPSARKKGVLYRFSDFFLKELPNEQIGYALVMEGNTAALDHLNRFHPRYPHMPHAKMIGQWHVKNILLAHKLRHRSPFTIRHAVVEDIEQIVQLLAEEHAVRSFSPPITKEKFLQELETLPHFSIDNYYIAELRSQIVGVCCAWDMTPIKRNRILSYNRKSIWMKRLYQFLGMIFKLPRLPEEGDSLKDVTITDYAVQNRDPDILQALLRQVYHEYRDKKYHMLIFGCSGNDALKAATRSFLSLSLISNIYLFSKSGQVVEQFPQPSLPFMDMTLL